MTTDTQPTTGQTETGEVTDTDACLAKCSPDLTQVLDCQDAIIEECKDGCDPETLSCIDPCQMSRSVGCEFYPTRMSVNSFSSCFAVFVVNTSDTPAHIQAAFAKSPLAVGSHAFLPEGAGPDLEYQPYDEGEGLAPGGVAVLFLVENALGQCPKPAATTMASMAGTGKGLSFHLTTDVPVAAYQVQPYGYESALTGASLLVPTSGWGTSYIAVNANQGLEEFEYFPSLNILGMEDDTQVSLTPVVDLEGGGGIPSASAGETVQFTVNAGVYAQITQFEELSGSRISADKPIGLLGGHECMQVPLGQGWCDHGEQMIPPVRALGHEYVGVMHKPRTEEGSFWRLFGVVDDTELSWSEDVGGPASLGQGEVVEWENDIPFTVASQDKEHPFMLFNLMGGSIWLHESDGVGDPDLVLNYSPEQYEKRYVFVADPNFAETHLVIVRKQENGSFHEVELDCAGNLGNWTPVGEGYEWTRVELTTGNFESIGNCSAGSHEVVSEGPFGLWVWGWGSSDESAWTPNLSYGHPGGMNVRQVNNVAIE